jgi:hypothetical protein
MAGKRCRGSVELENRSGSGEAIASASDTEAAFRRGRKDRAYPARMTEAVLAASAGDSTPKKLVGRPR